MDIKDILKGSIDDQISALKSGRQKDQPDIEDIKKKIDPEGHDIMDVTIRRDKQSEDENGNPVTLSVCRTALALQWTIIERAVAFMFGNEVKLQPSIEGDIVDSIMKAISRINKDNKIDSINREVARSLFTATEVAEYWYTAKTDPNERYGFKSPNELKCKIFSPLNGDTLYPYFDEYGKMIAFSRAFQMKSGEKTIDFFETWTSESYFRWKKDESDWVEDQPELPLVIKKIPIVYATQDHPEYYRVQTLIDRLETILSNLGDTNDYFSSPFLLINGQIESMPKKGTAGRLLQAIDGQDQPASAEYVSWDRSPESLKLEIETLLRQIFSLTQTPDISFESVKGIGSAASGTSLKLLFMDPHLKVQNKMEILDSYLTRRSNIQLAFLSLMNKPYATTILNLAIDNIVTPYMIGSDTDTIENLVSAVNNKIMSRQTAVSLNPLVDNAEEEVTRLETEANSAEALDDQQNEEED